MTASINWIAITDRLKAQIRACEWAQAESDLRSAMQCAPHDPRPHNLMGVLMEASHDHICAMKHFRAAVALEPAYMPARLNLDRMGTFGSRRSCLYDERDLPGQAKPKTAESEFHVIRSDMQCL